MKSSQLMKALFSHPMTAKIFKGVFPRNRIPTIPDNETLSFVVNTDPAHKPGKHWVAFYINKNTVYYFDSYGLPPKGFGKILTSRSKRKYFTKRLQGNGKQCGHYCLFFLLHISHGEKLPINMFSDDLNANDRVVKQFIEERFQNIRSTK